MTKQYKTTRAMVLAGAIALLTAVSHAGAASADAIVNKLVQKGILTQQEADDLSKEADKDFDKRFGAKLGLPNWDKKINFAGDFRLRMDEMWPESGLNVPERLRFRMRFRYGATWDVTDWATIGLRLGTGDARSSGGDANPNSNNQTFTHFFSKKPLFVDAAYVTIHPPDANWVSVTGGKMNKLLWEPGFNSPTIYDPDLTPEGAVEQFKHPFGPDQRFTVFGNAGEFVLDELSGSSGDGYMFDGQAGITVGLLGDSKTPALKLTAAGGYALTKNLSHIPTSDGSGNRGNSVSGANYLGDFDVLYGRGEAAWTISQQPFLGTPAVLTISGEFDKNLSSAYRSVTPNGDQTTAWTGQIMFGQGAKKGQWQIGYQYKYVEADAVLDSLSDDDFGGTDRKGHIFKAAYNLRDWWTVGTTLFITEKISGRDNSVAHAQQGIKGQDQVRLFVDTMFKF